MENSINTQNPSRSHQIEAELEDGKAENLRNHNFLFYIGRVNDYKWTDKASFQVKIDGTSRKERTTEALPNTIMQFFMASNIMSTFNPY